MPRLKRIKLPPGYTVWYERATRMWRFAGKWLDDDIGGTNHGGSKDRLTTYLLAWSNYRQRQVLRKHE